MQVIEMPQVYPLYRTRRTIQYWYRLEWGTGSFQRLPKSITGNSGETWKSGVECAGEVTLFGIVIDGHSL